MATAEIDDFSLLAPPAKRLRLDNELTTIDSPIPTDDMDDFYGTNEQPIASASVNEGPNRGPSAQGSAPPTQFAIPGLGRLGNASIALEQTAEVPPPVLAEEIKETDKDSSTQEELNTKMSGLEDSAPGPTLHIPGKMDVEIEEAAAFSELNAPEKVDVRADDGTAASEVENVERMDVERTGVDETALYTAPAVQTPREADLKDTESQPLTHALEALLGGLDTPAVLSPLIGTEPTAEPIKDDNPEWEVDSSPYESSSDDSSSDDSSEEDSEEDGDTAYKLLSPEEQARILMEGDGGSDDESGAAKTKGAGGQLRTKNEVPEEIIAKPDVTITPEMRIEELGVVEAVVENIILIKAKTSGEYSALESGSVLCLADRSVFGVVSETLGRVQQPLYTVRFTNGTDITDANLSVGTEVFYSEQHAKFALTQVLRAYKGSDASNLHDEEVGDEEIEFSDDEAEAEHKRKLKQKKIGQRGGKMQQNGGHGRAGPHGHPLQQLHLPTDNGSLNYDDAEDDGPYKPLARPSGFADTVGRSEAPQEGAYTPGVPNRGRGEFRGRGRGDRGRGRGDRGRGRGRGGFQDRRDKSGFSQTPQDHPQQSPASSQTMSPYSPGTAFSQSPAVTLNTNNPYSPHSQTQYSPQQPTWPQFPLQSFQQQYQGFSNTPNGWPNMPPPPPLPSGAFINPAFFAGNQQGPPNHWQQGQQNRRGPGGPS